MYPDFQVLVQKLLGIDAPSWLSLFKTFGLFVALGFMAAAYVLVADLKRKEKMGLFQPTISTIEVGKPATPNELLWSAIIGFLLGHKLGGFFGNWESIGPNPMGYLFSIEGNFLVGIVFAGIMTYMKYSEKKKEELPEPKTISVATYPHHRISEFVVAAMIAGIGGAKLFNAFETWDDFIKNPIANLISSSGLTFYGGLITAGIVILIYARKHKISIPHLLDSFGPAMIIAYGIGRIGCQLAGDGDWGIFNSAYVTQTNGNLAVAKPKEFIAALHNSPEYMGMMAQQYGGVDKIPHIYQLAPKWLPDWLFAMNYPNNVNNEGMLLTGSIGNYNAVLPVGVFPTPLFEAIACILLFFVLWAMRKKMKYAYHLFGWYLIFSGLERFFVEKIRVNYKYNWGFIHPTQAEIISIGLLLLGVGLILFSRKKIEGVNKNLESQ